MSKQVDKGRIVMLIDNTYALAGQLELDWRISWTRFIDFLETKDGDNPLWRVFSFAGEHVPPKASQMSFYAQLKRELNFTVKSKPTKSRVIYFDAPNGERYERVLYLDKGLDVMLVTTLLSLNHTDAFDTVYVLSGDGDLAEALQFVEQGGKRIEVMGWRNSISRDLENVSTTPLLFLDDYREQIEKTDDHQL